MKIVKPLRFNPFTFSRDSVAKYLDASGDYVDAAPDVLRLGYGYDIDSDSLVFSGSIIEDQGFNYIADSNDFNGPGWTLTGTPSPSITEGYPSPDGTSNAALFTPGGLGTQQMSANTMKNFAGATGLFSVFVKALAPGTSIRLTLGSSTSVFKINVDDYEALETIGHITPFPNGWFRCEIYATGYFADSPRIGAISGASFYVYGAQLENGIANISFIKRASSYVHQVGSSVVNISGTAVTRVSGTNFTEYEEGMDVTIATNNFVINTITDANNLTLVASSLTASGVFLNSRTYRAPDIVVDQTPSLITSNIAEDDADVWDNGDSYTIGERVMVLGEYHRVYEALENNTGKFPPDFSDGETPDWLDTGATNRWRMFDMEVGPDLQSFSTVSDGGIEVLIGVESPVSTVVLLNVEGDYARVTQRDPSTGDAIFEREIELLSDPMDPGWWEFFFDYRDSISKVVITDLIKIAPATIFVEIIGAACKLGKLIVGEDINIGCTQFGTSVGITDFSRKERDPFGNNYILERRYIDKADYPVQMTSDKVDATHALLSQLRATPAVYVGSENYLSTVVYGYYKDFSIVISNSRYSQCSLSVEGI